MIEFTLLGVPVRIHPLHWVGLAILGGVISVSNPSGLMLVALFMIAGFLGILAHEMGHALTGRKLGNAGTAVTLIFLGGYTEYFHPQFSKHGRSLSILAGPGATVMTGILGWLVLSVYFQNVSWGTNASFFSIFSPYWALSNDLLPFASEGSRMFLFFIACLVFISFWWTLLNLLPIMPLDGGQFIAQYVRSPRRVHLIGIITAALVLAFALWSKNSLLMLFMIFMGFENFKAMKQAPF